MSEATRRRSRRGGSAGRPTSSPASFDDDAVEARRRSVPVLHYPEELPVSLRRQDIAAAIQAHQVVVVAGQTGSGKTTQIPKICLEVGRGCRGLVGHTQPRRIAARAVAERIAEETRTELGTIVGYTVRFNDQVSDQTLVKVMTDGILLAELRRDRDLLRYDTIIIDEAHERSLNIDFLLGYLHQLLPRRPDLKVVITSATIDTERFSRHFGGAPIIEVSGRNYPVEVRYRPIEEDDDRDQVEAVCDAVTELTAGPTGDVLVFLSGEREIRDTADGLARCGIRGLEILPLYARLSPAEQHRVFQEHAGRRVVLATNVAETSLTVPGIRYVVDAGTARISRFNRRTKVQRLPIEAVSRASADQRAGRCGRVAPGVCVRLYSEQDYLGRAEFTDPEILRTNLASVILQMANLELGDVARFPFLDPPDPRSVKDGMALLEELGALDGDGGLTSIGRRLALLPIDPRLGRMVLEAHNQGCVADMLVLASGLSIQDPRQRPTEKREEAAALHARFADERSDFVTLLNLWRYLQDTQRQLSSSQFRKRCKAEHLNYLRVREWQDLHAQLRQVTKELRLQGHAAGPDTNGLHIAILSGLLSHVGLRDPDKQDYQAARNGRFALAPGTPLAKHPPTWVMAAELVETNRVWARMAAAIDPAWIERMSAHVAKRTHRDPRWDATRGTAVVTERVTLFGLPVVSSRRIDYSRVDRQAARDLFIHHALVHGEWNLSPAFAARNLERAAEVRRLEDRVRREDLLVDEDAVWRFFDDRLPADVTSMRAFERWWTRTEPDSPDLLDIPVDELIDPASGPVDVTGYPDVWTQSGITLALRYRFEPGEDSDGVSVEIPIALLNQVTPAGFDWHVPGLRHELVSALIRSLPKAIRRNFVPAPDVAAEFLARSSPSDGPLLERLQRVLPVMRGEPVPAHSWDIDSLPPHLRMRFEILSDDNSVIASSRDLVGLQHAMAARMDAEMARATAAWTRTGARTWEFGTVPAQVEVPRGATAVVGFPGLIDEGQSVGLRVFADPRRRDVSMWTGTRRLLLLCLPLRTKDLQRDLPNATRLSLGRSRIIPLATLLDDCRAAAADRVLADTGGPAWDAEAWARITDSAGATLLPTATAVVTFAARIVDAADRVDRRLTELRAPAFGAAVRDVEIQLGRLVYPGFVTTAGSRRLPDVLRYLRAVEARLAKLPTDPGRDRAKMEQVQQLATAYERAVRLGRVGDAEVEIRWMLEELRVSLFAQALGTPRPISVERIRRVLGPLT